MSKGRKAKPVIEAAPGAPAKLESGIPEELATVWDEDIAKAFRSLLPKQQDFLFHFLRTGVAAEAYRKAYNQLASDHLAAVCGSRMLTSAGIAEILAKFANQKTEALFMVIKGYREMAQACKPEWKQDKDGQWENVGDVPDWYARKEAYLGIRKVHGLDAPAEMKHSGAVAMTHKYDIPNKRPVGT